MSYKINFINRKLMHRRVPDNIESFQRVLNGPVNHHGYKGDFFKIITAETGYGELFFGYFTSDPSCFFYGAKGCWGYSTVNIVKFNEWVAMLIMAFRMSKTQPEKSYQTVVRDVNHAIEKICANHVY